MVTVAMKLKDVCSLEGKLCKARQRIKKQRHHFADKDLYCQKLWFFQLSAAELMLSNHSVGENSLKSLELQGDQTSQS